MTGLSIKIPNQAHRVKTWFNIRNALFQIIFPIILTIITIFDLTKEKEIYKHIAFYTTPIILLHTHMRSIVDMITRNFAEKIVLKKDINLEGTVVDLELKSGNSINENIIDNVVIIKDVYKLRYSNSNFFYLMNQIFWFMGIDAPILIPQKIISEMGLIDTGNDVEMMQYFIKNLENKNEIISSFENNFMNENDKKGNSIYDV